MGIWRKTESRPATGPVTPGLFALRGRDRRALAATLERLALLAPRLSGPERQQLAADWCRLGGDVVYAPISQTSRARIPII